MGKPIICKICSAKNGLLLERCRGCGFPITLEGTLRSQSNNTPAFSWETKSISQLIAEKEIILAADLPKETSSEIAQFNAHDFLKYCLLLHAIKENFERDDHLHWFDDCLFFLRGGFNFGIYLNWTSFAFQGRGRIFAGLNHADDSKIRLATWLRCLIDEAKARKHEDIDIFVAEEVNAGHGIRGFLNAIYDEVVKIAEDLSLCVSINFHIYLICKEDSSFDPIEFCNKLACKAEKASRKRYIKNDILVENNFRLFKGPLPTYDSPKYSGLYYRKHTDTSIAQYKVIECQTNQVLFQCPITKQTLISYSIDNKFLSDTLVLETHDYVKLLLIDQEKLNCSICQGLIVQLIKQPDVFYHHMDLCPCYPNANQVELYALNKRPNSAEG